jgi:general secretion pathway protein G
MLLRRDLPRPASREAQAAFVRAAFTLMEMLIVVAIIVALAGLGGYYFLGQLNEANKKIAKTKAETTIMQACVAYYTGHGNQWPQSLQVLLQKDDVGGPYLKSEDDIKDPWGNYYQYNPNAQTVNGAAEPEIFTSAPDGTRISNHKQH